MGWIYVELCDYRQAMEYLQQNLTAFQGERRFQSFGSVVLPAVQVRVLMVRCLSELGEFAAGVAYGDDALQIVEAVGRRYDRLRVYSLVGHLHVRQGALHQAIPLLERAVALSQEADLPNFYRVCAPALALAYALAGRAMDALAVLRQVGETTHLLSTWVASLACGEGYLRVGNTEEADRLAQWVLTHARDRKARGWEAQALWLLGEIAMHRNPPDVALAEAHYRPALALAEELGMRPLQAHCHHSLGPLYAMVGQQAQARAALTTALEMYHAMDMMFWLPQAEAALAQVERR